MKPESQLLKAIALMVFPSVLSIAIAATAAEPTMPKVPPVDLSKTKLSDFSDNELNVPYYLVHFHRLANSIKESGANRGFITLPVWRPPKFNHPYNARVMENHLAFAYFYCTNRKWNPYYGHQAVRQRLEAVLDFWCRIQNTDGRFSEYSPGGWNLSATGFSVMFMGGTLALLHEGPPIDRKVYERVVTAQRKAITALLTDESLFDRGKMFSNQYSGLWSGMLAFLQICPDAILEALIHQRLAQSLKEHMSPAGYWYEGNGCDWKYTFETHHNNILMAWHYVLGNASLEKYFIEGETRWAEWLAYNALREPDGSAFVLNMGINSRTAEAFFQRWNTPLAERVQLSCAFASTKTESSQVIAKERQQMEKDWPKVQPLQSPAGDSYSPHYLLNIGHRRWFPTKAQRDAAIRKLPYLASKNFNHQRVDDRFPQTYTFARRKSYYAAFNTGRKLTDQQRFGLGLLWNPQTGAVLQSQTGGNHVAWGTVAAGAKTVYEIELAGAKFKVASKPLDLRVGSTNLPQGELTVTYPLGEKGRKIITFADDHITVTIEHEGNFTEQLPLLQAHNSVLHLVDGIVTLGAPTASLEVRFDSFTKAETQQTNILVAGKKLVVLHLRASNSLAYRLSFT